MGDSAAERRVGINMGEIWGNMGKWGNEERIIFNGFLRIFEDF